jgi:uncharacterized membrane protein YtjA (UPF0391 family)
LNNFVTSESFPTSLKKIFFSQTTKKKANKSRFRANMASAVGWIIILVVIGVVLAVLGFGGASGAALTGALILGAVLIVLVLIFGLIPALNSG